MTFEEIKEEALNRFWKGDSYKDVSDSLQAMGAEKEDIAAVFNLLFFGDINEAGNSIGGYGFLPGLTQWKIDTEQGSLKKGTPVKMRAPVNRAELNRYLHETESASIQKVLDEEHPVITKIYPGVVRGELEDLRKGKKNSLLRTLGRSASDVSSLAPRVVTAPVGMGINAVFDKDVRFANPGDVEGFFNDPWLLPSMFVPLGVAGKVITGGSKAAKAGRFLADVGVDALGSFSTSRMSDQTEDVSVLGALMGGTAGSTVGRVGPKAAEYVSAAARKIKPKAGKVLAEKVYGPEGTAKVPDVEVSSPGVEIKYPGAEAETKRSLLSELAEDSAMQGKDFGVSRVAGVLGSLCVRHGGKGVLGKILQSTLSSRASKMEGLQEKEIE